MVCATVSSQSCFCWLYKTSPSLAAKNNQSDFSVDHLVMSMCRVFSCVVGRGCLLWPVCSLGKTLLAFALLRSVLQGQICLLLQVILDFLLLHSSPLWWKGHLFWVLVLEGLFIVILFPFFWLNMPLHPTPCLRFKSYQLLNCASSFLYVCAAYSVFADSFVFNLSLTLIFYFKIYEKFGPYFVIHSESKYISVAKMIPFT